MNKFIFINENDCVLIKIFEEKRGAKVNIISVIKKASVEDFYIF
jgi:hypothetical protein